jgi:NADH-quinone oxidoreductase subunit L
MALAVAIALAGFLVAWSFYLRHPRTPERLAATFHAPYELLLHKYYVDEIYSFLFVRPLLWISTHVLWHVVDTRVIDGTVNGVAHGARGVGSRLRQIQSGNARSYAAWVVFGAVLFTGLLMGLLRMVR